MKRLAMTCMLAAAALAAAATGASAQSAIKAEIPFAFQAGGTTMAPGAYDLHVELNSRYVRLRNTDTGKVAIAMYASEANPLANWRARSLPRLRFECAGSRCVLRQMWPGSESRSFSFRGPGLGRDEAVRVAEIPLTQVKAQ